MIDRHGSECVSRIRPSLVVTGGPVPILQEFAIFLSDLESALRARGDWKFVLAGDFQRLERGGGDPDIPNEILKIYVSKSPCQAHLVYNDCLMSLTFPPRWNRARLVLIRKGPDKPPDPPSSYRPICMLDTLGKILERLLLQKLESHL